MCGIAGYVGSGAFDEEDAVLRMCEAIRHRGPDSRGIHSDPLTVLGIQRLAVIDVEHGQQPIYNEDDSVVVTLNGEIYNFKELREELSARGHRFRTASDTEVIVHLYEEDGPEFVNRLRGMFVYALWDRRREELHIGRDRLGKKPLFLCPRGDSVFWASELYALLRSGAVERRPNLDAIDAYLALQYVPHDLCAVQGVFKLPPGARLVWRAGKTSVIPYWSPRYEPKVESTGAAAANHVWELLKEATRIRLRSDVPLGAFLSGGIDSSAVVAAMSEFAAGRVKTFAIGFADAEFDETRYARLVAERFGTEHHERIVKPDALAVMPVLARHYGEPYADPSAVPTYYLSEFAAEHVTVALNGDGGDESFAGYGRYALNSYARRFDRVPRRVRREISRIAAHMPEGGHRRSPLSRARRLGRVLSMTPAQRYAQGMSAFDPADRMRLLTKDFLDEVPRPLGERTIEQAWQAGKCEAFVDTMLSVDLRTYLPDDLLVKVDIASMAHSLEARSPFLDHELVEFAATLPGELKLQGLGGKVVLKQALRGILPDEILDRKKMGFGVPLVRWFREEMRDLPAEILLDPATVRRGYFRREELERIIREHQEEQTDHSLRLWVLLQLEMWHREVLA